MGKPSHHFGPFRLDPGDAALWRGDDRIHLNPKAFGVLTCLVERAGTLVTKQELLEAVWPQTAVVEAVLTTAIREIRQALGDRARSPRFIETAHGRGYRFLVVADRPPAAQIPVGRDDEHQRLCQRFERSSQGQRAMVFIAGEAGIGKTTVVDAFIDAVAHPPVHVARGQCVDQHGAGEPYLPILEALGRLGRQDATVAETLMQHAPSWLGHLPALTEAPSSPRPTTSDRMLRELAEALEVITETRSLILILEDLHWSDASTVQCLAYIGRRRDRARLMIIGTYRPVEAIALGTPLRSMIAELRPHPQADEIVLDYLRPNDIEAIIARRFPTLADLLAPVLHERTRGHPLFTATILDALAETSMVRVHDAGGWTLAADLDAVRALVPDSVRAYIERRIEQLAPQEQAALEAAAVAGSSPCLATIAAALDCTEDQAETNISPCLFRREMIDDDGTESWPDGTCTQRLRFRHALYQEVLYRRLSAGRRARLHGRIGHRLETAFEPHAAVRAAELATHFEAAEQPERAARFRAAAAHTARLLSAYPEALNHIRAGLTALTHAPQGPDRDDIELALQLEHGATASVTRGWAADGVDVAFDRAMQLARTLDQPVHLTRALFGALGFHLVRGNADRHLGLSEALLAEAQRTGDDIAAVVGQIELGGAAFARGDLAVADEYFTRGIDAYSPDQHRAFVERFGADFGVFGLSWGARLAWHRGDYDAAQTRCQTAIKLAHEHDHPMTLTIALAYAALLQHCGRRPQAALAFAREAGALAHEYGLRYYETWSQIIAAWSCSVAGDPAARADIRQSIEALIETGARRLLPYFWSILASEDLRYNAHEAALTAVAEGFRIIEATKETAWAPELHRLRSWALRDSNPTRSQRELQTARRLAKTMDAGGVLDRIRSNDL